MTADALGEVIFEYVQFGGSVRVTAIHAATGTEVTLSAPVSLSSFEMQKLGLQKLKYVLKKKGEQ
jgi:hypothetical protein